MPGVEKKRTSKQDALETMNTKKGHSEAVKQRRLSIMRRHLLKSRLNIETMIDQMENGSLTEEQFQAKAGMSYFEAVKDWHRKAVTYEKTSIQMMVPDLLTREECQAIIEGDICLERRVRENVCNERMAGRGPGGI